MKLVGSLNIINLGFHSSLLWLQILCCHQHNKEYIVLSHALHASLSTLVFHPFNLHNVYSSKTIFSPLYQDTWYFWTFAHILFYLYLQVLQPFCHINMDPQQKLDLNAKNDDTPHKGQWGFLVLGGQCSQTGLKMV